MASLKCGQRMLDLSSTQVMGILNVTPDSFSDGGKLLTGEALDSDVLLRRAQKMVDEGASILDIGGESTRPGAEPVSEAQEMDRVLPALELIVRNIDVVVSLDTSNASLMREGAALGAGMINDVRALEREGALEAAAESGLAVCLMHMKGSPQTMQRAPEYASVTDEMLRYLLDRAQLCQDHGIDKSLLLLDPGIGFGKSLEHNLQLLRDSERFLATGYGLLIGTSRKSMFGQLLNREVDERLAGSLASVAHAAHSGASIVRVHDVRESADVVNVIQALK
ncbi:MAG: dihydropteroate synthase [Pseudomonadales bacterium]